ncbi:MAG: hypothetical protein WC764_00645 [Candidatus Paceibacterota bacterium]|jgi:hypothetical protein
MTELLIPQEIIPESVRQDIEREFPEFSGAKIEYTGKPHLYKAYQRTSMKYTVRISKDCDKFIQLVNFYKN